MKSEICECGHKEDWHSRSTNRCHKCPCKKFKAKEEIIGCGMFDTENTELARCCGDILFSNKIWLCKECRKKKYSKNWEKLIDRN